MYKYLLLMAIAVAVGFQSWRSVFNNFSVEVVGITGQQMGIIQSFREIPGLLAFLVIYLTLILTEHKLAAICIAILGAGVALTGVFPTFHGVIFTTMVMSFGFHYYSTVNQSLTLQYFTKTEAPLVMSSIVSISSAMNVIASLLIIGLAQFLEYQAIFIIIGVFVIIMASYCLTKKPTREDIPMQHKKMVLRKKYWLYYVLTVLSGSRRQIFVAFAVFLIVQKFGFSIEKIAFLFIINNVINFFFMPYVGKLINKIGERWVLSIEYICLIGIFLTYAFTESETIVTIMYVLDHMFFGFAIALHSYFKKTADHSDIAPSMAVSFTINHAAAVILPAIGGLMWTINYKIPFIFGAFLCVVSLLFVQCIKTDIKEEI